MEWARVFAGTMKVNLARTQGTEASVYKLPGNLQAPSKGSPI